MEAAEFDRLIERLERAAARHPGRYRLLVIAVAALGFGILAVAFSFALVPVALLAAVALLTATKGIWVLLLLAKLGKLALLLVVPAWTMIKTSFSLLFARFDAPQGRELKPQEAPQLFERLAELRRKMKGPPIHQVLLVDELNAAIVQHPRFGLLGWESNILILGLPLLQSLGEGEALAVVAHEYGHLSGYHGRLGGFIYRFRTAWARLQQLSNHWTDWGSRLIARLFSWYAPYFNACTFVLARQNEYIADRSSVEIAGRDNAARALMRSSIASQFAGEKFWPAITRRIPSEPEPPGDRSAYWDRMLRSELDAPTRARLLDQARQIQANHLNTHPALKDRLAAIGVPVDDTASAAQELAPPTTSAASIWLAPVLEQVASQFDAAWRESIAEKWRARHAELARRQQRLAELRLITDPDAGQMWEIIEIESELQPDANALPALQALLERAPEHLPARFRRGALLLAGGDAAGIDDLEFVMGRDANAGEAGCELARRFFESRDPQRAGAYRQRMLEYAEWTARAQREKSGLPADADLVAAELAPAAVESVKAILREHGQQVRQAYILKRLLKVDPSAVQHVLAVEIDHAQVGSSGADTVKRLVAQSFPGPFFVVHLGAKSYQPIRDTIKRLGIEPLALR
jgi:Zn-dependent protease with chaperone function